MARVALAVLAVLLASHGCAAVEDTTTIVDWAQLSTTDAPSPGPVSAAARASCVGPMLLALLLSGHGCAAVDDTTTVAEDLHLSTTDALGPVSAAPRASGLGPTFALGAALGLAARR